MIFVGVGLTLAGCGTKKAEQTALHPVYGVADLETLVKSHPKYSEYFRLETEYSHLVEKYKNSSGLSVSPLSNLKSELPFKIKAIGWQPRMS